MFAGGNCEGEIEGEYKTGTSEEATSPYRPGGLGLEHRRPDPVSSTFPQTFGHQAQTLTTEATQPQLPRSSATRAGDLSRGTTIPGGRCAGHPVRRRTASASDSPLPLGRGPQFRATAADAERHRFFLKEKRCAREPLVHMASSPAVDVTCRRREKRRQLDARRSKCRIRLGGHMEQWCLLKERLGFSLHSQLAKFLLDRYTSSGCVLCAGPEPLPPKGLQYLVLLSHAHSRECSLVPGLRGPGGQDGGLVWECSAGHTFSWGPSLSPTPSEAPKPASLPHTTRRSWCSEATSGQELADLESEHDERTQEARLPRRVGPPPETFPPPGEEEGEEEEDNDEDEEEMLSDASLWTYSSSPDDSEPDAPRLLPSPVTCTPKEGETPPAPAALSSPLAVPALSASSLSSRAPPPAEVRVQPQLSRTPQAAQQTEALASTGSQAQSAPTPAWDEDTAQIGPKRIRKAAKRELMPCDFPGCGRIFSNRQYLNHHKKYQHIHQKSFSCPEPACGKSFNFKKHLKEHMKLHSGVRYAGLPAARRRP
ncbi:zinc finger protein 692 isoform X2 [Pan troglodytes]|uniref:zinc finger protein 692 isoform X2 n=1 Tax=Pan troglodytes TaxID=9598 RepID=UPI003013CB47